MPFPAFLPEALVAGSNPDRRSHYFAAGLVRILAFLAWVILDIRLMNAGTPVSGSIVYTGFFDQPRALYRAEFSYDGLFEAKLGPASLLASLSGFADGIVRLPEEGLAVGCGSIVAFVNPETGSVVSVPSGIDDAYHVMLDASGTNVWTGNGLGFAVVPLAPPRPGQRMTFQDENIIPESVAWLGYRTVFFAADGVIGRLNPFDPNGPTTTPLPGRAIAGPALVRDPWTEDFILAGGRWIQQLRVIAGNLRLVSSRLLPEGVDLDHIDLDGRGHFFGANARGTMVFIDFSTDGLIGSTNHFVANLPVPILPGQTGAGGMDGVQFLPGFGRDPGNGGGDPGNGDGDGPPPESEAELIHWWPGNGTFEDVAGDRPLGSVGKTAFRPGAAGQSFHLVDGQSWLTAPPAREWDLGNRDFTFAVWVWFDGLEPEGGLIGNYEPNSSGNHGRWAWEIRARRLRFFTSRGAGNTGSAIDGPDFDPLARRWYHLALTKSGSLFHFFINGRLRRETIYPLVVPPEPGPLSIGPVTGGARLDEVRWYRRALTPNQVSALYLSGDRVPPSPWVGASRTGLDQFRLNLRLMAGRAWVLEQSADLQHWTEADEALTPGVTSADRTVGTQESRLFFRVRSAQ